MDYDRLYDSAITQEKRAINLISLIVLVIAALFFFAAILLKDPVLGFEPEIVRNVLMVTAAVIAIGGIVPHFVTREKIEY